MKTILIFALIAGFGTYHLIGEMERGAHHYVNGLICAHEEALDEQIHCQPGLVAVRNQ